jgi:hypothetical protein
MPMIAELRNSWPKRRLAYISVAISAAEVLIIGGAIVLVQILQHASPPLERLADGTWLIGSLASFGFAFAAFIADSNRRSALVALAVAALIFLICGFPLMIGD